MTVAHPHKVAQSSQRIGDVDLSVMIAIEMTAHY